MQWRSIGKPGEPYPAFVRELRGKMGVYAIRRAGLIFTTVVYVGESHTAKGGLYKTITRHFQSWSRTEKGRKKAKWYRAPNAPEQSDPGHTYDRGTSEIAVHVCRTKDEAIAMQAKWIESLRPRDNLAGTEALEEAPF